MHPAPQRGRRISSVCPFFQQSAVFRVLALFRQAAQLFACLLCEGGIFVLPGCARLHGLQQVAALGVQLGPMQDLPILAVGCLLYTSLAALHQDDIGIAAHQLCRQGVAHAVAHFVRTRKIEKGDALARYHADVHKPCLLYTSRCV